jgi:hypothetical protein
LLQEITEDDVQENELSREEIDKIARRIFDDLVHTMALLGLEPVHDPNASEEAPDSGQREILGPDAPWPDDALLGRFICAGYDYHMAVMFCEGTPLVCIASLSDRVRDDSTLIEIESEPCEDDSACSSPERDLEEDSYQPDSEITLIEIESEIYSDGSVDWTLGCDLAEDADEPLRDLLTRLAEHGIETRAELTPDQAKEGLRLMADLFKELRAKADPPEPTNE